MDRHRASAVESTATRAGAGRTRVFLAAWCPSSQRLVRMLARHPDLAARLELLDVDAHEALADAWAIDALPCFVRPDGERHRGALGARELRAFLGGSSTRLKAARAPSA